jgi:PAS domain S-box-containing protein
VTADADEQDPLDYPAIFAAAPSPNLIVRAEPPFIIVAANDAYLAATMTTREQIVGRGIFEAFPPNPNDPDATGVHKVRQSIEHVIAHRQPHTMAVQKYDIPRPDGGGFEERYWSPIHTPVFGPDGEVAYVIQRPEDVTEFVRLKARAGESDRHEEELRGRAERMEAEVFLRGQELAKANADLQRQIAERERAEVALAREQDFLRAVLDHAADGIVACDGDGVLRFFNGAARAFHGAAERPLPPERWAEQYDLYLPDGTTRMTKEQVPLFRALAEGSVKDVEMVIAANGHPPRLLTANGRAITDAEGRKLGAVVVMHDLTARKQAEAQRERAIREEAARREAEASAQRLRESEGRFRLMADAVPQIVWITDAEGRVEFFNQQWSKYTGIDYPLATADDVAATVLHPDDRAATGAAFQTAMRTGQTFAVEHRIRSAAGEYRWFLVRGEPHRDVQTGRITRWFGASVDIHDRRRAEEAQRQSEERLRAVFEQTEAGIAQVDLTGRFVLANERYAQIVGRTREELLGLRMQDITHPDDLPGNLALFQKMVADGSPFVIEKRYVRPDGTEVWVSNSVSLIRGEGGKPGGVVAATVDITDRRQAEQVLQESEAHARRIIDNTLAFVGVMTPNGTLTEANATALRAGGLRRQDVVGRKFWDCYWWSYDPQVQTRLREAVLRAAGGEVVRYDVVVRMAGDTRMPIDFMLSPVKDDHGRVTHLIPSGMDIAERVRAEEEVRRSQRQLASVIDNAPSAVFIKDVRGRYLLVNVPFERMAGVPVGSMTGKTDADLFPPEIAAQFRGEDERVAASREPMAFEESFEFKGQHLTFVTSKFPLRDEAGEVYAVCGIATDVTALKRAEAAVRESEQRLRLGLRAGRTGTWDWDIAANRVVWSEQLYEFHGLRPEEFGGTSEDFAKLVHLEDAEHVGLLIQGALRDGKPYEVEFRTVRPSGEVRWLFTTGQVTRDNGGNPVRMMGATIDTTDRKQAEAERERLLESERVARFEAERASRMKDEFLATLSHELRTPLNAILGWSQILAKSEDVSQEIGEGLQIIERNARAQTQIIEDLLDMSRIVNGKVRLDVQPVELASVVHAAVDTVRPTAEAKGVRLQVVLDPLAGPVSADPSRLQQVFWNLLTNAIKFTPRDGRVQVVLERVNSHLEVAIADTGSGIKPEFLPHVFDRFRQADASTTRRHGGLGIGLAIVKQLVEMHGGSVRAKSAGEGMGSTFTVALPLAPLRNLPEHHEAERRHPAAPASGPSDLCAEIAGVRVLVVDDEPDARGLVKRLLENCGAEVRTAASAGEAMTLLTEERPDVLISDIGMPDEDGYALIRMVRALPPDRGGAVPAVALTAYARSEDRVRAMRLGYQNHVVKPVEPAELVTVVATLAGRYTA